MELLLGFNAEVLHNGCTHVLPDMCTLIPHTCDLRISGIHIRQISCVRVTTIKCNTFTPHIKTSSHATYIMLHSLSVLQLSVECATTFHWNADNFVINCHPQCICHIQVAGYLCNSYTMGTSGLPDIYT